MKLFDKSPGKTRTVAFSYWQLLLLLVVVSLIAQSIVIFASASAANGGPAPIAAVIGYLVTPICLCAVVAVLVLASRAAIFIMKIRPSANNTKKQQRVDLLGHIALMVLIGVGALLLIKWFWSQLNFTAMLAGPLFFVALAVVTWLVMSRAGRSGKGFTRSNMKQTIIMESAPRTEDRPARRTTPPRGVPLREPEPDVSTSSLASELGLNHA